jgi:hypothetical protein
LGGSNCTLWYLCFQRLEYRVAWQVLVHSASHHVLSHFGMHRCGRPNTRAVDPDACL